MKGFLSSTALTFFLGWWSLSGLMLTPYYLIRNLLGGEKITVGRLLEILYDPEELKKSNSAVEFGPAIMFLGFFGILLVLAVFIQVYAALRRAFGH